MDRETAYMLNDLNAAFYRSNGASFSATRQAPWEGWHRCAELIVRCCDVSVRADVAARCDQRPPKASPELSVLDVACGNLRFEHFLEQEFPQVKTNLYTVDNSDGLVGLSSGELRGRLRYQNLDVVRALLDESASAVGEGRAKACTAPSECDAPRAGGLRVRDDAVPFASGAAQHGFARLLQAPACDVAVSFGFMHHVPTQAARQALLAGMASHTKPGGVLIVSLWQFMKNERIARKARRATEAGMQALGIAELDEGDYLLGWKDVQGAYRYCHHFSDEDIDAMLEPLVGGSSPRATLLDRFEADGRSHYLNTYVALRMQA